MANYPTFKSEIANKILNYFFLNPDERRYVNELARILNLDPKNTYRKLIEYEKVGLLKSETSGVQKYFSLNLRFPLLNDYRRIFIRSAGLEDQLKQIVENTTGIKKAYLFGSYAADKMDNESDIDLIVIGDHSSLDLQRNINNLQQMIGREINTVNYSFADFEAKKDKDPFLINVFKNKTIRLK